MQREKEESVISKKVQQIKSEQKVKLFSKNTQKVVRAMPYQQNKNSFTSPNKELTSLLSAMKTLSNYPLVNVNTCESM